METTNNNINYNDGDKFLLPNGVEATIVDVKQYGYEIEIKNYSVPREDGSIDNSGTSALFIDTLNGKDKEVVVNKVSVSDDTGNEIIHQVVFDENDNIVGRYNVQNRCLLSVKYLRKES